MMLSDLPPEQRWHEQEWPAPIVVALIRRPVAANHYLLIKRNGRPYSGQWALVGGKWEFGETMHEAIEREVTEETGLQASFVALRGLVSERLLPQGAAEHGAHFLILICELSVVSGQPQEMDEGAVGWFSWAEIIELQAHGRIVPSDYAMLDFCLNQQPPPAAYIEAEMRAAVLGQGDEPTTLLRFDQLGQPKPGHRGSTSPQNEG